MTPDLLMTAKEARKLLGVTGRDMSDTQIIELVQNLTSLADIFLQ